MPIASCFWSCAWQARGMTSQCPVVLPFLRSLSTQRPGAAMMSDWGGWQLMNISSIWGNNIEDSRIKGGSGGLSSWGVQLHGSECIKVAKDGELNPPFADPHGLTKLTGATITIHNSFMIFMNYKSACLLVKSCEIPSFSRWNPTPRIFLVNPGNGRKWSKP